jgi:membrane-bound serine protease (ClpP class)
VRRHAFRLAFAALLIAWIAPALSAAPAAAPAAPGAPSAVLVATVRGSINPVTADYLSAAVARAEESGAGVLVVELDTPGGLESAMRDMVKDILKSRVPVVVYVSPSGGRAASAGVLVTLAADVAAMAPGTNIGAAHPVSVGGGTMDNTMAGKVENDSAAYARSLAAQKGRNPAWAESAVRKSVSLTEREALDNGVIDLVSPSLADLLERIDGREVKKDSGVSRLRTKGAPLVRFPMDFRHRALAAIADPNVAYILMMIGIYGLFFELSNPGAVFPGVAGGIALILGFYAMQTLSADYAGLLMILLGVVLFLLEVKVHSYGALSIGGTVAMFLGSLMLFRSAADPWLRISWSVLATMIGVSVLFFSSVVWLVVRSRRARPMTGDEGMVGAVGEARSAFGPGGKGRVFVEGELWEARSDEVVSRGDAVTVSGREGMTLRVRPGSRRSPSA